MEIKHQQSEQSADFVLIGTTGRIGVEQGLSGKQDELESDANFKEVSGKLREESVLAAANEAQIMLEIKDEREASQNVETLDKDVDFEISGTIENVEGPHVLDSSDLKYVEGQSTDKLKIEESEVSTLQVDEEKDIRNEAIQKKDFSALVDDIDKAESETSEGLQDSASIDENEDFFYETNSESIPDHSSKSLILDDDPILGKDSIILRSLGVKSKSVHDNSKLSPFTKNIKKKSESNIRKKVPETTSAPDYYLDYSAYADYYNDPDEEPEHDTEELPTDVYRFRDYPMEDGYVRIPVFIPGLEMAGVSEVPKLWNAQDAFMRQVGSKLYMFIPSAILGFIIGLLVWIIALVILRTFGVFKKTVLKVFKKENPDELDLKVKYVTTGDPWIKISDAEKIHSVNGAIRKSVIGPCSPEKIKEFNQQVLETVNLLRSPGSKEIHSLENEDDGEVVGVLGNVREEVGYWGRQRRFSH